MGLTSRVSSRTYRFLRKITEKKPHQTYYNFLSPLLVFPSSSFRENSSQITQKYSLLTLNIHFFSIIYGFGQYLGHASSDNKRCRRNDRKTLQMRTSARKRRS